MTFLYDILGVPFGALLRIIYETVAANDYVIAVILLTLIARLLMFPTSISQQKGMAKTQRMQAKIRKIQTKYAGNQQKIQEETTALYQREGFNPMGSGCAPMIPQFIILFGLIGAIYYPLSNVLVNPFVSMIFDTDISDVEITALTQAVNDLKLAGQSSSSHYAELHVIPNIEVLKDHIIAMVNALGATDVKTAKDLGAELAKIYSGLDKEAFKAAMDVYRAIGTDGIAHVEKAAQLIGGMNFDIFGISLGETPTDHWEILKSGSGQDRKEALLIWLVPVLSFVTSMLTGLYSQIKQKKNNPAAASNAMMTGCMTFGMPIFSLIIVIRLPIAIGIYWIASGLFGFISQVIVGKLYSPKKMMARLMVDETVERRSKENYLKSIAEVKNNKN